MFATRQLPDRVSETETGPQGQDVVIRETERYLDFPATLGMTVQDLNAAALNLQRGIAMKKGEINQLNIQISEMEVLMRIVSVAARDTPVTSGPSWR
ncbi:MAG: hypothetical protein JWP89_2675 [Schlesneria sp.]|nr:hypothetical protein [Schlesneria sp.]